MLLCDINPFVRQAIVGHLTENIKYDVSNKLKTVDCRLFCIKSGHGEMIISGKSYLLHPGTVILFSSGTEYTWLIDNISYYSINFDYTQNFSHITRGFHPVHSASFCENDIFEQICFDDEPRLNKAIVLDNCLNAENLVKEIVTAYYTDDKHKALLLSSLLKSALLTILYAEKENRTARESKENKLVREVIEYINANYSKNISNNDIAEEFHFHPTYINRIFKRKTNCSIHEFLLNCRLNASMEILRTQNIPVSEIAALTGFGEQAYFTRIFKKRTGKTPTQYRRSNT